MLGLKLNLVSERGHRELSPRLHDMPFARFRDLTLVWKFSCYKYSSSVQVLKLTNQMHFNRCIPLHKVRHDGVIHWKYFPRYWPFVHEIHWSLVNSPHKGQWRGAYIFSLICTWINVWVHNLDAGDLRRHRALYDVIVICEKIIMMV